MNGALVGAGSLRPLLSSLLASRSQATISLRIELAYCAAIRLHDGYGFYFESYKSEHFVKCQHFFGCILELEKVKTLR